MYKKAKSLDREVYRQLELLGMIDNQTSIKPIFGLIILILLQMSFLFILFDRSKHGANEKTQCLTCNSQLCIRLSIVTMKLISLVAENFDLMLRLFIHQR